MSKQPAVVTMYPFEVKIMTVFPIQKTFLTISHLLGNKRQEENGPWQPSGIYLWHYLFPDRRELSSFKGCHPICCGAVLCTWSSALVPPMCYLLSYPGWHPFFLGQTVAAPHTPWKSLHQTSWINLKPLPGLTPIFWASVSPFFNLLICQFSQNHKKNAYFPLWD